MKLLTSISRGKKYSFICLETEQDADSYSHVNAEIKAHQSVNFWMGFKSQTFRQSPSDYYEHEESQDNIMGAALSVKLSFAQKPVSLVEYCNDSDNIINEMNNRIFKYIRRGDKVRINSNGGYCPISDFEGYEIVKDITEIEMFNFLLHKETDYTFEISGKYLVIENDRHIPEYLIKSFSEKTGISPKQVQIFNSFKHRTVLFKEGHFIKLFKDGIKQGLEAIIFETTAQDVPQINKLKAVFEHLMPFYPDRTLNIWCKIYEHNRKLITSNVKNIKINFL